MNAKHWFCCSFRACSGGKQHGHLIARSDYVSDFRRSVTIVTSSFSSGHGGPLGVCVPDGFMTQEAIDTFNSQWTGVCWVFASQSQSHFMSGETFVSYLHGLVTPALARHRQRLGLPPDARALLLCDAWSGFHSHKTGLDAARLGWSQQACCDLPALQAHELSCAKSETITRQHHKVNQRFTTCKLKVSIGNDWLVESLL